jgi:hypothetical protein
LPGWNGILGKESLLFLKKRSKKLLIILASACPDRLSQGLQEFFGAFFKKALLSATCLCLALAGPKPSIDSRACIRLMLTPE